MTSALRMTLAGEPGDDRRARILRVATAEFAEKGLAGARVAEIAEKSGANKQLIYYYFKSKVGLYEEVLGQMLGPSHSQARRQDSESFGEYLRRTAGDVATRMGNWFRFWMWESLEKEDRDIIRRKDRADALQEQVMGVRRAQEDAELDPVFDPEMLALAIQSIVNMPHLLPQITMMTVGVSHDSVRFERRQAEFLAQLVEHLAPRAVGTR
jgi:AcrR family transcriptional regulator